MTDFIIKSTISLGIIYLIYLLFLSHLNTFKFNRFFLLGALVFSLIIPFITIPVGNAILVLTDSSKVISVNESIQQASDFVDDINREHTVFNGNVLRFLYLLVCIVLLLRVSLNLFSIIKKIRNNQLVRKRKYILVLINEKILPYSFFNYIMVNKNDYENGSIDETLMQHEIAHCHQWHSFDILLVELCKVFFWINPFVWLLKKPIQLNHEYLADSSVLINTNVGEYQKILFNTILGNNTGVFVSNFNFSLTKQRLKMMTKQFSKKKTISNILVSGILVFYLGMIMASNLKNNFEYKLTIDGIHFNHVEKGLKPSEFAMLEISTNKKRIKVDKFEIILARGARIIRLDAVTGNSFDLNYLSKKARDGDRIVIEIKELSDKNIELTQYNSIITIPIDFSR